MFAHANTQSVRCTVAQGNLLYMFALANTQSGADGHVSGTVDYDVFGEPVTETGVFAGSAGGSGGISALVFAYAGKPYDPVTGLSDYGFRDYAPTLARFTTVDPIRDGSNWYAYCNSDPVNYVDMWGLETTVMIIHADSPWEWIFNGSHVAIHFSNPGKDEYGEVLPQTLYDPSGSYEANTGYGNGKFRPSSGVFMGDPQADLNSYIESILSRENGEYVVTYSIDTTPGEESAMIERALQNGDGWGFSCADYVSDVLTPLGFNHVLTPGGLEDQLKKSDKVTKTKLYTREDNCDQH